MSKSSKPRVIKTLIYKESVLELIEADKELFSEKTDDATLQKCIEYWLCILSFMQLTASNSKISELITTHIGWLKVKLMRNN